LPAPMQRNGHDEVGFREQFPACSGHPAGHHWRKVQPVAVLQCMHESARDVVIAHHRARTPVGRRIRNRFEREETCAGIERKWSAKPLAGWRRDERKPRPAGRAKTGPLDRLAASRAQLRKRRTERKRTCGAKSPAQRRARRPASPSAWAVSISMRPTSCPAKAGIGNIQNAMRPCAVDGPEVRRATRGRARCARCSAPRRSPGW